MGDRKYVDCREAASDSKCTLKISGTEGEVIKAAADHMVSAHGQKNSSELKSGIKKMLKDESDTKVPFPRAKSPEQTGRQPGRGH